MSPRLSFTWYRSWDVECVVGRVENSMGREVFQYVLKSGGCSLLQKLLFHLELAPKGKLVIVYNVGRYF